MPQATNEKKKSESTGDDGPAMGDRAASGLKAVEHIQKAMAGGKLRQAFSLWRASSHLRVVAAGVGGLVRRRPLTAALVGGGLTAGVIYVAARSMADSDGADDSQDEQDDASEDRTDDERDEEGGDPEAEAEAEAEADSGEEEEQGQDEGDDEPEEASPAPRRAKSGSRSRR